MNGSTKINMLIMIAITTINFYIFTRFVSWYMALIITAIIFIAWFTLNMRSATVGLIKANLNSYFTAKYSGATHQEAIKHVISTRYPLSEQNRRNVWDLYNFTILDISNRTEKTEIKELVYIIFCHEMGCVPSLKWQIKIRTRIESVYEQMNKKYSRLLLFVS